MNGTRTKRNHSQAILWRLASKSYFSRCPRVVQYLLTHACAQISPASAGLIFRGSTTPFPKGEARSGDVGRLACCPGRKDGFRTSPHISPLFAFIASAARHRQEEIIIAVVNRMSHMIVPPLMERLPMAAPAPVGAENPAPAHNAPVTSAVFRPISVQGAKCVYDIVECDRPSAFSRSAAQRRYRLNCASIGCP
jgi:hypothetical protein